jgi:hypothetical protein
MRIALWAGSSTCLMPGEPQRNDAPGRIAAVTSATQWLKNIPLFYPGRLPATPVVMGFENDSNPTAPARGPHAQVAF